MEYKFSTFDVGMLMATIGVGFVLAFTVVLAKVIKIFTPLQIAKAGMSILTVIIALVVLVRFNFVVWCISWLGAVSMACAYSAFITMFSSQVSREQQGWVMGVSAAISAFSFGITGLLSGILAEYSPSTPFWAALLIIFSGVLILLKFDIREKQM